MPPPVAKEEAGSNKPLKFHLELDPTHAYLSERGLTPETVAEFGIGYCGKGVMAGRIAMRDVKIDGYVIPKGERCGLMFAAANRDPRKWQDPEKFDIRRNNAGHLGFGFGVHACVGRVLALLEADALLGAMVREVESFEPAGPAEPWMTTIGHGPVRVPVRIRFT